MTTAITLRPAANPPSRRWFSRRTDVAVSALDDIEFTWDNRRPGTPGFATWTAAVGQRIDENGLSATFADVDNLIGVARRMGVAQVALDVLADSTEPDAARCRAFAAVVAALASVA